MTKKQLSPDLWVNICDVLMKSELFATHHTQAILNSGRALVHISRVCHTIAIPALGAGEIIKHKKVAKPDEQPHIKNNMYIHI